MVRRRVVHRGRCDDGVSVHHAPQFSGLRPRAVHQHRQLSEARRDAACLSEGDVAGRSEETIPVKSLRSCPRPAIRVPGMLILGIAAIALSSCAATERKPAERSVAIAGATIVHPERDGGEALAGDSTIVVTGNQIAAVGPARTIAVPAGATIIDARGKWVVPGLIDGHVHFFQSGNLYTRPDAADFNAWMAYAKEVERNKARLPATFKVWHASGVTTVVDVGGPFWNFDVRDSAARTIAAPRVAVAGPLISTVD